MRAHSLSCRRRLPTPIARRGLSTLVLRRRESPPTKLGSCLPSKSVSNLLTSPKSDSQKSENCRKRPLASNFAGGHETSSCEFGGGSRFRQSNVRHRNFHNRACFQAAACQQGRLAPAAKVHSPSLSEPGSSLAE